MKRLSTIAFLFSTVFPNLMCCYVKWIVIPVTRISWLYYYFYRLERNVYGKFRVNLLDMFLLLCHWQHDILCSSSYLLFMELNLWIFNVLRSFVLILKERQNFQVIFFLWWHRSAMRSVCIELLTFFHWFSIFYKYFIGCWRRQVNHIPKL